MASLPPTIRGTPRDWNGKRNLRRQLSILMKSLLVTWEAYNYDEIDKGHKEVPQVVG